jgi:hypothetical protein
LQTAVAAQRPALLAAERHGAGGSELAAEIGLVERAVVDRQARQARDEAQQRQFRSYATEHEMRMLARGRDQRVPRGFNRGMCGLNGLLWRGQIRADEQIDVRRLNLRDLRETKANHEGLLSKWHEIKPPAHCGKGRAAVG